MVNLIQNLYGKLLPSQRSATCCRQGRRIWLSLSHLKYQFKVFLRVHNHRSVLVVEAWSWKQIVPPTRFLTLLPAIPRQLLKLRVSSLGLERAALSHPPADRTEQRVGPAIAILSKVHEVELALVKTPGQTFSCAPQECMSVRRVWARSRCKQCPPVLPVTAQSQIARRVSGFLFFFFSYWSFTQLSVYS